MISIKKLFRKFNSETAYNNFLKANIKIENDAFDSFKTVVPFLALVSTAIKFKSKIEEKIQELVPEVVAEQYYTKYYIGRDLSLGTVDYETTNYEAFINSDKLQLVPTEDDLFTSFDKNIIVESGDSDHKIIVMVLPENVAKFITGAYTTSGKTVKLEKMSASNGYRCILLGPAQSLTEFKVIYDKNYVEPEPEQSTDIEVETGYDAASILPSIFFINETDQTYNLKIGDSSDGGIYKHDISATVNKVDLSEFINEILYIESDTPEGYEPFVQYFCKERIDEGWCQTIEGNRNDGLYLFIDLRFIGMDENNEPIWNIKSIVNEKTEDLNIVGRSITIKLPKIQQEHEQSSEEPGYSYSYTYQS